MTEPRRRHGLRIRLVRHRRLEKLCRRKEDGSLWRPSAPDGYGEAEAVRDLTSGRQRFYFRRVVREHRRWWFDCWLDTGEVWRPKSGEFQVLDEQEAIPS